MSLKGLICCLCLLLTQSLFAQKPEPVLRRFSTLEGLPSSQIYQVMEDDKGYLWFATDHGVARYSGYEFKVFSSAEGLLDNTVFKLFLDSKKRMWLQTFSGQLFYIENEKVIAYKYNSIAKRIVKNAIPLGFYVNDIGEVYFSCNYAGEFRIDTNGIEHREIEFPRVMTYNQVFVDEISEGKLLTSGNKLYVANLPTYLYTRKLNEKYDSIFVDVQFSGQVFATYLRDGRMIFAISKFIFELKNRELRLLSQVNAPVTYLYEGKNDDLWVSTYSGLYKVSTSTWEISKSYLEKEFISSTTLDFEGGLWITSINSGVYYFYDSDVSEFKLNSETLIEPMCLTRGKNCIYAGFWNGVVGRFDVNGYSAQTLSNNEIYVSAMFYDEQQDRLLISSQPPGYLKNNRYVKFKSDGTGSLKGEFIRLRNGGLINASINGLYKLENDSLFLWSILTERANCIVEYGENNFLLGSNSGVYLLDSSGTLLKLFHPFFEDVRVDDIERKGNTYFFATRGRGLIVMNQDSIFVVDEKLGLRSNIIHKITLDKNNIWCASYNGVSGVYISSFSPFKFTVRTLGFNEGLSDNEINDIAVLNDTVWVATKKSISFFDSRLSFANTKPPLFYFTNVKVNNRIVKFNHQLVLDYNANNISIGFEALSFKSYGQIKYRYWLVNESDTFESVTSSRHVDFLSLKPGKYTFSAIVSNSSGIWSDKVKSLSFTIRTPFWQEWWFRILVVSLFGLLIFYFVKLRISRIREKERLRTDFNKQLVMLEIKALRAQMNPHFIFNVINSIQDYILKNDALSAQRYLTKFAKLVRSILDNSVEGEVLLDGELDANALYVELEQQRFDDKFEFDFNVSEEVDSNSLLIPSMIIQPFLENAIRHGLRYVPENAKLSLNVHRDDHTVFIYVQDNGIGRKAAAELNKINASEHISHGSLITSRRVEAYNKAHNTSIQLTVIDLYDEFDQPSGTRVELLIPVKYRTNSQR